MDTEATEVESYSELRDAYNGSVEEFDALSDRVDKLSADSDADPEVLDAAKAEFNAKFVEVEELRKRLESKEARDRARAQFQPLPTGTTSLRVSEPDLYERNGKRSFFVDLYLAQLKGDSQAQARIEKHQKFEAEKRAITSSTLGGVLPPAYLTDLYAKAARNGRVYADQANGSVPLPDVGMSVVIPRITVGLSAGVQATESTAVTTSDPTEVDLSVPVRTIAGYSPVSRQTLERSGYADQLLFEDLIARYWAALDSQCISGSGSSGQILGVLGTSSIATSTASTATVAGVWPKIADIIQQINTNVGGLGYVADKIFMHPRRWGFFEAALDSQNRPLMPTEGSFVNVMGSGVEPGYGLVGRMHGLNVYTDANIPTNLGTNTNEDRIIVEASNVVHLFERGGDPVTLSFEQQAGTSLQVQLVAYGYAAFTAGRYPGASGVVSGAGLVPPTF